MARLSLFGLFSLFMTSTLCSAFAKPPSYSPPPASAHCTKPYVRKEWGSLTKPQRTDYINALKCMQKKPSILPAGEVPGAKSRYDDFVAVHVNQTIGIHIDGVFLSWHREFTWLWEQALRNECGYKGYQPYWNWALWADDLGASPLFDGSETSVGGDGYYVGNFTDYVVGVYPNGTLETEPRGTGGGCMKDGPFVNMTVGLGPFDFGLVYTGLPANWTDYTPHCVIRDLNNAVAARTNQTWIDIALATKTIADFQFQMSAPGTQLGLHGAGHFCLGGQMQDFFASPADPSFFLHHGQVDRIWDQWQAKDRQARTYGNNAINGTDMIFNPGNTPEVHFSQTLNWGVLGGEKTIGELMSVREGQFCYEYQW